MRRKKKDLFWHLKTLKFRLLEKIMIFEEKRGWLQARLILLVSSFIISTILTSVLLLLSGLMRYKESIPLVFACSNTFLTYHIVKPYLRLMNKWAIEK